MILSITDIGYLAIQVIIAFTPVNTLCKKGIAAKNVLDYIYFKKMAVLSEYILFISLLQMLPSIL